MRNIFTALAALLIFGGSLTAEAQQRRPQDFKDEKNHSWHIKAK